MIEDIVIFLLVKKGKGGEMMTADTEKMRNAASEVADEERKYTSSVEEINGLITNKLAECWGDEAYDELNKEYTSKSKPNLEELGRLLKEFSNSLNTAADDLDKAINSLR